MYFLQLNQAEYMYVFISILIFFWQTTVWTCKLFDLHMELLPLIHGFQSLILTHVIDNLSLKY